MPGDGPQRGREQRLDTHAGQFAGVDHRWRRSRLSHGLTMPATKFDKISEENIGRLVDDFYDKIRADPELGPIFLRVIPDDWDPHLATMRKFWSSVMLTSGLYKGDPVAVHRRVVGIEMELFDCWLNLFHQTSRELFVDDLADAFLEKAARIAESLKLALFYRPDRHWPGKAS